MAQQLLFSWQSSLKKKENKVVIHVNENPGLERFQTLPVGPAAHKNAACEQNTPSFDAVLTQQQAAPKKQLPEEEAPQPEPDEEKPEEKLEEFLADALQDIPLDIPLLQIPASVLSLQPQLLDFQDCVLSPNDATTEQPIPFIQSESINETDAVFSAPNPHLIKPQTEEKTHNDLQNFMPEKNLKNLDFNLSVHTLRAVEPLNEDFQNFSSDWPQFPVHISYLKDAAIFDRDSTETIHTQINPTQPGVAIAPRDVFSTTGVNEPDLTVSSATGQKMVGEILERWPHEHLSTGNTHQLRIQLHPAELGEVVVYLQMNEQGKLEGVVQAHLASTLQLLRQESDQLIQGLSAEGFDVSAHDFHFGKNPHNPQHHTPSLLILDDQMPPTDPFLYPQPVTISHLAPDGDFSRLDIHIY